MMLILGFIACLMIGLIILQKKTHFICRRDRWSIGIYVGDSPYHFWPAKNLRNPVLTAKDVTDRKAEFVADPFMVKEQGIWYMFFEVLDRASGKGEIGLAVSGNGLHWAYRQIILTESFHLSYPYVFKWEGEYYMIRRVIRKKPYGYIRRFTFRTNGHLNAICLLVMIFLIPPYFIMKINGGCLLVP